MPNNPQQILYPFSTSHAHGGARGKYSHARSSATQPPHPLPSFLQLVIGGQKMSIQPKKFFCKKVQALEVQADAMSHKLDFGPIPFVNSLVLHLCKEIEGREKNMLFSKKRGKFSFFGP